MKLLYDIRTTQPVQHTKRHGGGKYGEVIFFRMAEVGIKFSCYYDSRKWLNPEVKRTAEARGITMYDAAGRALQDIVDRGGFDRVYSCMPGREEVLLKRCEVYGTIHGLRSLETPWDSTFFCFRSSPKLRIKYMLRRCLSRFWMWRERRRFRKWRILPKVHFIAVSNHTRYAMLSYFPELKDRDMKVFYSPNTSTGSLKREVADEKYFFAVSGNRWEKNNLRAIIAFDRLLSSGLISGVRMKIAGGKRENITYKIQNPEAFDFLGYVSDQELERLYAGAYLFVYPSLNEGFGYPPLEAMRYGVPVIASPFSSMAEVCAGGVLYFNPFSVEEIMNRMMMMMEASVYDKYSRLGHSQYIEIKKRQDRDLDGIIDYISKL